MIITVSGTFARGLILIVNRPQQRGPDGKLPAPQEFVLTPEQSQSLLTVLEAKWKVENKGNSQ